LTKKRRERVAVFQPEFREDLRHWVETDRRVALRVLDLVEAVLDDPFRGMGKPEPLRHLAANTWSRRVTQEHRLVYLVRSDQIDFLQARYHYLNALVWSPASEGAAQRCCCGGARSRVAADLRQVARYGLPEARARRRAPWRPPRACAASLASDNARIDPPLPHFRRGRGPG
jgi:toxin YoeB